VPHVDATRFEEVAPESYVRWKIVPPRMAQATEVQINMNTMAAILFVISFYSLTVVVPT
jgi:hypothetical protein